MFSAELIQQAKMFYDNASLKANEYADMINSAQGFILDHFGQNGLYASYIVTAALLLVILMKLAKLTFAALKYLVVPSVALAFAGSFFMPLSFMVLLPVTVSVCSLVLLFKG